jgi:hypothetical protein
MSNKNLLKLYINQFQFIYQYTTVPDDIVIIDHNYIVHYFRENNQLDIKTTKVSLFDISIFDTYKNLLIQHSTQYLYCEFGIPYNNNLYKLRINKIKNNHDTVGWVIFISNYNEENVFFKLLNRTNFKLGLQQTSKKHLSLDQLTEIQQIICYFILYNLSNEVIAKLMQHLNNDKYKNITKKHIERHLDILKNKLEVHSKVELIDLLIANHYYRHIPEIIITGLSVSNKL